MTLRRTGESSLRGPANAWRVVLLIDDFCLNTGLDRDPVENLARTGRLEGCLWTTKEPIRP